MKLKDENKKQKALLTSISMFTLNKNNKTSVKEKEMTDVEKAIKINEMAEVNKNMQ